MSRPPIVAQDSSAFLRGRGSCLKSVVSRSDGLDRATPTRSEGQSAVSARDIRLPQYVHHRVGRPARQGNRTISTVVAVILAFFFQRSALNGSAQQCGRAPGREVRRVAIHIAVACIRVERDELNVLCRGWRRARVSAHSGSAPLPPVRRFPGPVPRTCYACHRLRRLFKSFHVLCETCRRGAGDSCHSFGAELQRKAARLARRTQPHHPNRASPGASRRTGWSLAHQEQLLLGLRIGPCRRLDVLKRDDKAIGTATAERQNATNVRRTVQAPDFNKQLIPELLRVPRRVRHEHPRLWEHGPSERAELEANDDFLEP